MKQTDKQVIGLGGRKCSGKSTIANGLSLIEDIDIISCATALKLMCCDILEIPDTSELNRMKNQNVPIGREITGKDVDTIASATGIPVSDVGNECRKVGQWENVRQMLQFVGTDIIRKHRPTWHVDKLEEHILKSPKSVVVVDDVRFPNERACIEKLGGDCFYIIRPRFKWISNHKSETALQWQMFPDTRVIINEWEQDELVANFNTAFSNRFRNMGENPTFLYAKTEYLHANTHFGLSDTDGELAMQIVGCNNGKPNFAEKGVIEFEACGTAQCNEFAWHVLGKSVWNASSHHRFFLYNPLILENLKKFA